MRKLLTLQTINETKCTVHFIITYIDNKNQEEKIIASINLVLESGDWNNKTSTWQNLCDVHIGEKNRQSNGVLIILKGWNVTRDSKSEGNGFFFFFFFHDRFSRYEIFSRGTGQRPGHLMTCATFFLLLFGANFSY